MSRIYFHSPSVDTEVYGPERAHAGIICSDIFAISLGIDHDFDNAPRKPSSLRNIISPNHYVQKMSGREFTSSLKVALSVSMGDELLVVDGKRHDPFVATLNTALLVGSDPIKLLARLHGQCELHAYVEGKNRAWLAGIIEKGRATRILRSNMGWETTAEMLRSRDDEPVVTSYSVCDQFPNSHVANWTPPMTKDEETGEEYEDRDVWYDLPKEERWGRAFEGLKMQGNGLELTPDDWDSFFFGDGMDGFQLREIADSLVEAVDK